MAHQRGHYQDYDVDIEMHPGYQNDRPQSDLGKEREPRSAPPPPLTVVSDSQAGQLALYDEQKAYAEWQRGEAQYRQRREQEHRPAPRRYDEHDLPRQQRTQDMRRDSHSRDHTRPYGQESHVNGALLGGGAGALLGRELVHGPLGTVGGAVVGALAGRSIEGYDEKKRRERDDERRRIRREYDSQTYDPRGSSRSSNFYDSQHASPAASVHEGRYPSMSARQRQSGQYPPRRQRRPPSSSSDSYTSDE